jgi:hypothetical protein
MTIRFAIWAAVSSERQAAVDKISLELQETACRARAVAKGWVESAGPFIVRGESRTRWINLSDARLAIVNKDDGSLPLDDMLTAAKLRAFDVLVLYDFTRLRELIDPVTRTLAAYHIQAYSLGQSVEPVPPEQFKGKITGSAYIIQAVSSLTSHTETTVMTERLRSGVAARVPKGLHPSGVVPYGYKLDFSQREPASVPLILDPSRAAVVVQLKDLYLAGQTIPQLIQFLAANQIPSPRGHPTWSDYAVRYILKNPFYAGEVGLGYRRLFTDPENGQRKALPGQPERNTGKHLPLWDLATHQALKDEMRRRMHVNKGVKTYRLSHLLVCPEHARRMHVHYLRGTYDDPHRIWTCPAVKNHWHNSIMDTLALEKLTAQLSLDLQNISALLTPRDTDETPLYQAAIADLQARRARLTDALESGVLDAPTYASRTQSIDARLAETRAKLTELAQQDTLNQQRAASLTQLAQTLADTPRFITHAPPQLVNSQLRSLIKHIAVLPDGEIQLEYR